MIRTKCLCSHGEILLYNIGDELPPWVSDLEGNGIIVISEDSIRYHGKYEAVVGFYGDYLTYCQSTGEVSILQRSDFPVNSDDYSDSLELMQDLDFENISEEVDAP